MDNRGRLNPDELKFYVGDCTVIAEDNKGHSPEYWADNAVKKICAISKDAPPHVRQQAEAYRHAVREIVLFNIMGALRSDRQTLAGEMRNNGYETVADQITRYRWRG